MTLKVNNKTFTQGDDLSVVRKALDQVPEPKCTAETSPHLLPEHAVIVLQREVVALDVMHLPPTVMWTGTKNLVSCIYVRIYNEEQELAIHVDSVIAPLDISRMIAHFREKNDLKVMLIGGKEGDISSKTLDYVLAALMEAPETITVSYQKLLKRNKPTNETKHVYIRDLIMRKMALIYLRLFKEGVDLNYFYQLPLASFDNDNGLFDAIDQYGVEQAEQMKEGVFALQKAFHFINEYIMPFNYKNLATSLNEVRKHIKTQEDFYKFAKLLFTKVVYESLICDFENVIYEAASVHFVIHMKTNEMMLIPAIFDTPYEAERTVLLHDHHDNDTRGKRYFLSYNQTIPVKPVISEASMTELRAFYKHLDQHSDLSVFVKTRGYVFFQAVSHMRLQEAAPINHASYLIRYHHYTHWNEHYRGSDEADASIVLERLNDLMPQGVRFSSKIRRCPQFVVDAILLCPDYSVAIQHRDRLKNHNIDCFVMQRDDNTFTLCVPGINVSMGDTIIPKDNPHQPKQPWI